MQKDEIEEKKKHDVRTLKKKEGNTGPKTKNILFLNKELSFHATFSSGPSILIIHKQSNKISLCKISNQINVGMVF
jgi:hypothetical protein